LTYNNRENKKKLRQFSEEIVAELKSNPKYVYSQKEIIESKHPDKRCQFCQQLGCDRKHTGFYIHEKCFAYVQDRTFKFMREVLNLSVKSK